MKRIFVVLGVLVLVLTACAVVPRLRTRPDPGSALSGLSQAENARFVAGLAVFKRDFDAASGLGPLFNSTSCAQCHEQPVVGGIGRGEVGDDDTEVHASKFANNTCNELAAQGGPVFRQHATIGNPPPIPATAQIGRRKSPHVFGMGLIDAIPSATIIANAGRSGGRPAILPDGTLGRFGRKATDATLSGFVKGAFTVEQGIEVPNELSQVDLDLTIDFLRFLAPPDRITGHQEGAHVFSRIGCAGCHTPSFKTGPSPTPALSKQDVFLYSDLVLHDLGPAMADLCKGVARPEEFRTAPLFGLRFKIGFGFLHDGRAVTIESAIIQHAGQAQHSVDGFLKLSQHQRRALLKFLENL